VLLLEDMLKVLDDLVGSGQVLAAVELDVLVGSLMLESLHHGLGRVKVVVSRAGMSV